MSKKNFDRDIEREKKILSIQKSDLFEQENEVTDIFAVKQVEAIDERPDNWDAHGHRDRVRDIFLKNGTDGFSDAHILEVLLFSTIPRKDTKPIAKLLLEQFGTLDNVLEADYNELIKCEGIGRTTASFLCFFPHLFKRYNKCKDQKYAKTPLNSTDKLAKFLRSYFENQTRETFYLLCLDQSFRAIVCRPIGTGDVNSITISSRQAAEIALKNNSCYVVISHNHPLGTPSPSQADKVTTAKIKTVLESIGIKLIDHIIFGHNSSFSFAEHGLLVR